MKDILLGLGVVYGAVKANQLSYEVEKLKSRIDELSTGKIRIRRYVLEPQTVGYGKETILGEWEGSIIVFNFILTDVNDYLELKFETPYETHIMRIETELTVKTYSLIKIAFNYVKVTAKSVNPEGLPTGTPYCELLIIDIPT